MIDSGATALFLDRKFVEKNRIFKHPLGKEIAVHNIDGTKNKAGSITHYARLKLKVGQTKETTEFLITDLGPEKLILGLPWLKRVNPQIDWVMGEMEVPSGSDTTSTDTPTPTLHRIEANRAERRAWVRAGIIEDATDEVWCLAGYTYSTDIAARANEKKAQHPFKDTVPAEYHRHAKVLSEEESERLPKNQPWDHGIDLKPDAPETIRAKAYPMSPAEQAELDKFLKTEMEKGYIVPSKSPYASPVFFVKKKDGKLRFIQDYRKLNEMTVKNVYPLPRSNNLIEKL